MYKDNDNNKLITPKNDIVFKKIFGSKGNEEILKDFLESILDIKIDSLTLDLATELLPEFYEGKQTRVDVRSTLSDGTEVNIEMQIDMSRYSDKRCLQHWSKLYANTLKRGEDYRNLRKTICIWILDGEVFEGFTDFHSKWEIANLKHGVSDRFNELEFHMIELNKFKNDSNMKISKKEFWLWFIDHSNKEMLEMAYINSEKIREAREQLDKIRADEELMERIRLEEAYETDNITRIADAKREGRAEGFQETAKKMLEKGLEINMISEVTGLSAEEINNMKKEMKI